MAPSSTSLGVSAIFLLLLLQPQPSFSQTCSTQTLPKNRLFQHCTDLPNLNSYLHWTYNSAKSTLDIAFISPPSKPNGWISWAINPTSQKMIGSQALIAYKDTNGAMTVKTFNISSFKIAPSKIDFEVPEMVAEYSNNVMSIFASIILPKGLGPVVNQVWQVGGSVTNGIPDKHDFGAGNMKAMGTLDLAKGGSSTSNGADSTLKKKNIHGILNVVSWGLLFPIGIIIARYLRAFESAEPAWFYLHAICQCSAYIIGVAGWGTGLKLGSQSKGVQYNTHRNIGITLFSLATLQVFALLLRPTKEHKYRTYWNFYHHGVGYAIVVLGIINVFKGLDILVPEKKWRDAYIIVLVLLGGISLLLEVITWIVVIKRKSKKSTKPYDGHIAA
ncbi:hypothetical protein ACHQM5_028105 [Ranunculus cassubicifolius]